LGCAGGRDNVCGRREIPATASSPNSCQGKEQKLDVMDKLINLPEDTVLYPHKDWLTHIAAIVAD